jgi:hypothetical protein
MTQFFLLPRNGRITSSIYSGGPRSTSKKEDASESYGEYEEQQKWAREQQGLGKVVEQRGPYLAVRERHFQGQIDLDRRIEQQLEIIQIARMYGDYNNFVACVQMLIDMIPDKAMDDQFKKDLDKAWDVQSLHFGYEDGGDHSAIYQKTKIFNPRAAIKAVINMLHRRGKFWKETPRATLH